MSISGRRWDRARTLARLRELGASGDRPRAPRLKHDEPALLAAAISHFGTFARAMRAAGFEQQPRRRLSRAVVLDELRALDRRDVRMTVTGVVNAGRNDLISAVGRYFGGFVPARKAAGIVTPPTIRSEIRWGRESVLAAIQRTYQRGEPLSVSRVDRDLLRGAHNSFRSWRNAVEAAGIDYAKVQIRPHEYSDDELLDVLRDIHRRHPQMTLSELHLRPPHGNILRQRFGDLRRAAKRIGIEDWPRRARPVPASKTETLRALRRRARAGASYGPKALSKEEPLVFLGAMHHFGGVAAAVKAAGIRSIKSETRHRLLDDLMHDVQRRDERGASLRRIDLLHDAPTLVQRAEFYFGSWGRAVKLALARRAIRISDFAGAFARRLRAREQRG